MQKKKRQEENTIQENPKRKQRRRLTAGQKVLPQECKALSAVESTSTRSAAIAMVYKKAGNSQSKQRSAFHGVLLLVEVLAILRSDMMKNHSLRREHE
jgi:hypothetical protein